MWNPKNGKEIEDLLAQYEEVFENAATRDLNDRLVYLDDLTEEGNACDVFCLLAWSINDIGDEQYHSNCSYSQTTQ